MKRNVNANVQFVAHFLSLAGSQELDRTLFENRRFGRSLNLMHTTVSRESSPASLPLPLPPSIPPPLCNASVARVIRHEGQGLALLLFTIPRVPMADVLPFAGTRL